MAGRGREPPGRGHRSDPVRLHGEPRQQRRGDVDGSRRTEISAIHYPQMGKLLQKKIKIQCVRSDKSPGGNKKKGNRANSGYNSVFSFPGDSDSFSAILLTYKTQQGKHHSMQNPDLDSGFLSFFL